ncbi:MAG: amino acid ABC transporter permease [Culicoidibacterales bacterium]
MSEAASPNFLGEVWQILINNYPTFIQGTITTLIISITATILGFFLGLLVAISRGNKVGNILSTIYISIFRGTPMMVQAMVIFYGTSMLIPGFKWANVPNGNLLAGIIVVTINTGAYMSETIRSGIQSLDSGQFEAAKSLGFSRWQTMTTIILPQAIKNVIPAIGNEFIVNIKDTSVLNVISVTELFFVSAGVAGSTYKVFQTFTITSLIYLFLTTIFACILQIIEKKLDKTKKGRTSIPASQTNAAQLLDVE